MAKKKALSRTSGRLSNISPSSDTLDAKINVSGPNKLLGRTTSGEGGHEELTITGLPAETTPASGDLLLIEVGGVLSKLDVANLPAGGGDVSADAIWDTKGDLAVATGANTAAKLAVGADGLFLQAASGESTGLKYAAATVTEVFTSSGTWTKPAGAVSVRVTAIAGGGGGGSGRKGATGSVRRGGTAGGSGGRSEITMYATDLGETESVTVGAGGAGGAAQASSSTNGNNGSNGGDSSFGSAIKSAFGYGGLGGTSTAGSGSGGGGGLTSSGQTAVAADAAGSAGSAPGTATQYASTAGGGGGGLPTTNGATAGGNGGTAISYKPSAFGNNLGAANAAGTNGETFAKGYLGQGGGGGGSSSTGNGGNGGNGGGYGAGGGGGGAAVNSVGNSGAGGNGSDGIVVVITYF